MGATFASAVQYLLFDQTEATDGVFTLEAMASTPAAQHAAAMAEARQVLDWAWQQFPDAHGPIDEGMDWDHDLQQTTEEGGRWHVVALTLTASPRFLDAFARAFPEAFNDPSLS